LESGDDDEAWKDDCYRNVRLKLPHVIYLFFFFVLAMETSTNLQLFLPQRNVDMTSRSFLEAAFIHPDSSPEDSVKEKSLNYRHPTVYDAVAGNFYLFLSTYQPPPHWLTVYRQNLCWWIYSEALGSHCEPGHSILFCNCSTSGISAVSKQECSYQIRRI
jgi:hypothetical protein